MLILIYPMYFKQINSVSSWHDIQVFAKNLFCISDMDGYSKSRFGLFCIWKNEIKEGKSR